MFLLVILGWVRFRSESLGQAVSLYAAMAGLKLPIVTHPLQAFVTEPVEPVISGLVCSFDALVYISQTQRGELLAGAEVLPYNTYSSMPLGATMFYLWGMLWDGLTCANASYFAVSLVVGSP